MATQCECINCCRDIFGEMVFAFDGWGGVIIMLIVFLFVVVFIGIPGWANMKRMQEQEKREAKIWRKDWEDAK